MLSLISSEIFADQAQTCGQRKGLIGKIVGGIKAEKNEWPWLVAFVVIPEEMFFCAGSLISNNHVLSGECGEEINCEL